MRNKFLWVFMALTLLSCTSLKLRSNRDFIQQRAHQLEGLNHFPEQNCTLTAELSQPVKAGMEDTLPGWKTKTPIGKRTYEWQVRKNSCRVTTDETAKWVSYQRAIVQAAVCTLLQTHYVNSPLLGINFEKIPIVDHEDRVEISTGPGTSLSLLRGDFVLETKTKARGLLRAQYFMAERDWVPSSLEQQLPESVVRVDQITYGLHARNFTPLESFWISVGSDNVIAHTFIKVERCESLAPADGTQDSKL